MRKSMMSAMASALVAVSVPALASAQPMTPAPALFMPGTRLDIVATGEVSRVPDVALISSGVVTKAPSATAAIADNAARMERVRAALRRAGIADRDIQTSSINLNPEYKYQDGQPPVLTGYQASNSVSIRFRDIRRSGAILDALVGEGGNQINGPTLTIDKPEAAMDEARTQAIASGRARAELYARSLGMRVSRVISVSEAGAEQPRPMPVMMDRAMAVSKVASTEIDPGERRLSVSVSISFELR